MGRNDGVLLIGLLGAFFLLGNGKKKKRQMATTGDVGGFFEFKRELYETGRNGNGNGRTSYYVTTPYPVQDAVSRLLQAERELSSKSAVSPRTKKERKGIVYGYGEQAYVPEKAPATYTEERALLLLDRP